MSSKKNETKDNSNNNWLLNLFSHTKAVRLILGVLSLSSIHYVFFWINLDTNVRNIVDSIFFANIIFIFGLSFLLAIFSVRVVDLIARGMTGAIYYNIARKKGLKRLNESRTLDLKKPRKSLVTKESQLERVLLYLYRKFIDKHSSYFKLISLFVFFSIFMTLYTGFDIPPWVFLLILILFFSIIFGLPNIEEILDAIDTKTMDTEKSFSTGATILIIIYIISGVFVALTGHMRYQYLISGNPVIVTDKWSQEEYIIIGKASDGILFYDHKRKKNLFIKGDITITN